MPVSQTLRFHAPLREQDGETVTDHVVRLTWIFLLHCLLDILLLQSGLYSLGRWFHFDD